MRRSCLLALLVLAGCRGPLVTVRHQTDPAFPPPALERVLTDPLLRDRVEWRTLHADGWKWTVYLDELGPAVRRLNKLEVHGRLTQSGSNLELRATDGGTTLFVNAFGPMFVDRAVQTGTATMSVDGTTWTADGSGFTFFQFTLTSIDAARGTASGAFAFIGRNADDPNDPTVFLAMEGQFSMDIG